MQQVQDGGKPADVIMMPMAQYDIRYIRLVRFCVWHILQCIIEDVNVLAISFASID